MTAYGWTAPPSWGLPPNGDDLRAHLAALSREVRLQTILLVAAIVGGDVATQLLLKAG